VHPLAFLGLILSLVVLLGADLHVWVDEQGTTHVTDDPASVPDASRIEDVEGLNELWDDGLRGPPIHTPAGSTSSEEDRIVRELRGAVDDLARGETARAAVTLRSVLRRDPNRPEAHFYLALLDGRRGRLDSAESHLRIFLATAGSEFDGWRDSALKRLERLDDERRLMESAGAGQLRLVDVEHPSFRIQADSALLNSGSSDFARTVARYLDDARSSLERRIGVVPDEPTGVVLYGKAAYLKTHGDRFSFQTVGFFDGRIHVVSAAHPAGELRTLLFHEYTHALFREQTGGDRPFWLNEGLAELAERGSQQRNALPRGERLRLWHALEEGRWLPLARLAPSFSGLDNREARLAYTISTAAAEWLDRHSTPAERASLLHRLGEGQGADEALRATVGVDTAQLDEALRAEIAAQFN